MNTIFYKSRQDALAFINPTDVTKPVEQFPDICISTFSKQIIDKFAAMEGVERIAELYSANGINPVYKIRYGGREIAFYLSLVGAPACACGLEEMIAMGGRKFVFFGCCGVLDERKVGDRFIIPTGTVREEGTSYHYLAPEEELEPDQEVTSIVKRCLRTHGCIREDMDHRCHLPGDQRGYHGIQRDGLSGSGHGILRAAGCCKIQKGEVGAVFLWCR